MTLGILNQRVRTVEPHGLRIEEPCQVLGWIMEAKPGRHVDDVRKTHRMALGKSEARESLQLLPNLVSSSALDPVFRHARVDLVPQTGHGLLRAFVGHRLSQPVGLGPVETRAYTGQLHQLLLEDGHPQSLLQDHLGRRVWVPHRLFAITTPEIWVDRLTLDGARPDQGNLDSQVIEGPRLHLRESGHLSA